MSSLVTKQILNSGTKKVIMHWYLESDGTDGELQDYVLLDPQVDLALPPDPKMQLSILKIWSGMAVFDVVLKWNALVPTPVWVLTAGADASIDFSYFGGLKDYSGVEHDGKLLISTNGFAPAGSAGSLILELKKD